MSSPEPILLLTHSGDYFTIDLVEAAVRARGRDVLRVDTDRFPVDCKLTARYRAAGPALWLDTGSRAVRLDRVPAVWTRRLWPGAMPKEMDARLASHCRNEARNAFFGVLGVMTQAHWVNPLPEQQAAESKPVQLAIACQVGLAFPETLLSNDPDQARAFYEHTGGKMITKLLGALSQTMDGRGEFMYTSLVKDEDVAALDDLRWAPQVFQPLVEKVRELRVIVVGQKIFVGSIDTRASREGKLDWRRATTAEPLVWREERLPPEIAAKVLALVRRLGLVYGAIDFLVDAQERYYFLEINPAGEWGWLERDLKLPIADAIADALVKGAA